MIQQLIDVGLFVSAVAAKLGLTWCCCEQAGPAEWAAAAAAMTVAVEGASGNATTDSIGGAGAGLNKFTLERYFSRSTRHDLKKGHWALRSMTNGVPTWLVNFFSSSENMSEKSKSYMLYSRSCNTNKRASYCLGEVCRVNGKRASPEHIMFSRSGNVFGAHLKLETNMYIPATNVRWKIGESTNRYKYTACRANF
jgi:hypothetical protein